MEPSANHSPRPRRPSALAFIPLLAAMMLACGGVPGVIPTGLADEVEAARASLDQAWDNGPVPPSFTFVAARCRVDGGLLILFDQRGFGSDGLAMAMQGPGAMPEAWAGGFAPVDPASDAEILSFFKESPEVACRP